MTVGPGSLGPGTQTGYKSAAVPARSDCPNRRQRIGQNQLHAAFVGLIAAESGSVSVSGEEMFKNRRAALSAIGILFLNPGHRILFPIVAEELAFARPRQEIKRREACMWMEALTGPFCTPSHRQPARANTRLCWCSDGGTGGPAMVQ